MEGEREGAGGREVRRRASGEPEAKQFSGTRNQFLRVLGRPVREFPVKPRCGTRAWLRAASANNSVSFTLALIDHSHPLPRGMGSTVKSQSLHLIPFPDVHWFPRTS